MSASVRFAALAATATVLAGAPAADAARPPAATVGWASATQQMVENYSPKPFTIARTGNLKKALSVTVTTSPTSLGDDAAPGDDYVFFSQRVTFPKNSAVTSFALHAVEDATAEPNETMQVVLSNPSSGSLGTHTTLVTILDDDQAGSWSVPAGEAFAVDFGSLQGCNDIDAWLVDATGAMLAELSIFEGCFATPPEFTTKSWTNDTAGPVTVRLALVDQSCDFAYYSDGTSHSTNDPDVPDNASVDHASVWNEPTGVAEVRINDAGGFCQWRYTSRNPNEELEEGGNLLVTGVSVGPVT